MPDLATIVIDQPGLFGRTRICIGSEAIEYFSPTVDFKARLDDVSSPTQYRREHRRSRLVGAFITYYVCLAASVLFYVGHEADSLVMLWLALLIMAFAVGAIVFDKLLRRFVSWDFTVVPTKNGNLLIRSGAAHDEVIRTIQERRLRALRKALAPDPTNSPEEEAAKLRWLLAERAISSEEYQLLIARRGKLVPIS